MKKLMFIFVILVINSAYAQYDENPVEKLMSSIYETKTADKSQKKNIDSRRGLKVIQSAIVPGLTQLLNGEYVKGSIFAGIEVISWGLWYSYDSKGYDKRDEYQAFADEHWDSERYVELRDRIVNRAVSEGAVYSVLSTIASQNGEGGAWTYSPEFWAVDFSVHNQHYYEDIGKYAKYMYGWDDTYEDFNEKWTETTWDSWIEVVNRDTAFYEPGLEDVHNPSPDLAQYRVKRVNREKYISMRTESNDNFDKARMMLNVILINHILSAFDVLVFGEYDMNKELSNISINNGIFRCEYKSYGINLKPEFDFKGKSKLKLSFDSSF